MAVANVNHTMLSWARNRAGLTVADMAKSISTKDNKISDWENGEKQPTFKQAIKFAKRAGVPFGYLFLSEPPVNIPLPIPDLRTVNSKYKQQISPELIEVVEKMQSRQNWYREYLIELQANKNNAVGRFNLNSDIQIIVADLRKTLGVGIHPAKGSWDNYYKDLVTKIESIGILVMRQRYVQFNYKEFNVDEFRGFALMDDYAPLIFINHADAPYARIFTLIHELAHLWIGQSGVSDTSIDNHRQEEKLCNAIAAEFLVDETLFRENWQHHSKPWYLQLDRLKQLFHVSHWVLARRALTLNLISTANYQNYVESLRQEYLEKQKNKKSSGGDFYNTRRAEISTPFSEAILNEINSGKLLIRDGADLLSLRPKHLQLFAAKDKTGE